MKRYKSAIRTIRTCQSYLKELYGAKNDERSWDYLYGYLCRTAGYLSKNTLSKKVEVLHFIRPLSWLFAFANKMAIDVEDVFLTRFPTICPYCLTSVCVCFKTNKTPPEYKPAWKANEELSRYSNTLRNSQTIVSCDYAAKIISSIYPNNEIIWYQAGPSYHFVKMFEEISEIHEVTSKYEVGQKKLSAIGEEVSDTFAWLVGAWHIVFPSRSLDDEFVDYYYDGCPVCKSFPCKCGNRADRIAESVDLHALAEISKNLSALKDILPSSQAQIEDLLQSLKVATEKQSEPTAVHAVTETKNWITKVKETVSTADEIGKKGESIIATLFNLLNRPPWQ